MTYCDAAALKRYLNITVSTDDTLLGECISRAQALIDVTCNRTFEAATDSTRTFDALVDVGEDHRLLWLDADLCAITSVTNGDGTTVAADAYTPMPRHATPWYALQLKRGGAVSWTYEAAPEDALTVVGRWAYSVSAPTAIVQACVRLAAWLYRQKDSNADPGAPRVTPEGTWIMPSALPKDVEALLKPFRRIAT